MLLTCSLGDGAGLKATEHGRIGTSPTRARVVVVRGLVFAAVHGGDRQAEDGHDGAARHESLGRLTARRGVTAQTKKAASLCRGSDATDFPEEKASRFSRRSLFLSSHRATARLYFLLAAIKC